LKTFIFNPDLTQSGIYNVLFYATDGFAADSELVQITVVEVGNQPPEITSTLPDTQQVIDGDSFAQRFEASDPEFGTVTWTAENLPSGCNFADSGNGVAGLEYNPTTDQVGSIYDVMLIAADESGATDTLDMSFMVVAFLRGDANSDTRLNVADISFLVTYVLKGGDPPLSDEVADANFDTSVNISDAVYLVNYIFKSGPPPPPGL
jgi:hypothetical protein